MPLWSADEAAAATGGTASAPFVATGLSIDSRTLERGDLFIALTAERDGHDFLGAAFAAGASAALVTHRPEGVDETVPLLIVDDVQTALEGLGRAGRARTRARVAGITGSVGKTSTKEMLRDALAGQGKVHASVASYNNHWGVPLTLARMPADTDYAVIEIGMNAPGEIAPLSKQARPHVAMVTTVGAAHLEAFENMDGIAVEKGSICDGLEPGGIAVLNGDLLNSHLLYEAAHRNSAQICTFGTADGLDYQLTSGRIAGGMTIGEAQANGDNLLFKVASEGRHFALNALGVIAVAEALGADRAETLIGLGRWAPPKGRGNRERLVLDDGLEDSSFELIDDAFNANPTSLSAALDVLAAAKPESRGRRIAILGDMLELGAAEAEMHAAVASDPAMGAVTTVHCVGPRMAHLYAALDPARRGRHADTAEDLAAQAAHLVRPGDVVLIKGSKGSRVSRVVDAFRKLGHPVRQERKEA